MSKEGNWRGLRLVQSNRLEVLAEHLADTLAAPGSAGPLQAPVIVVPNPGTGQWLKLVVAEQIGIAANLDLPLPSNFAWRAFRTLLPNLPEESDFAKEAMHWRCLALLRRLSSTATDRLADPAYDALRRYLADDADGLKGFQLARRIADVFDQYLVYRPDWIRAFETGGEQDLPEQDQQALQRERWQAPLWRQLVQLIGHSRHRAEVLDDAVRGLASLSTEAFWRAQSQLPRGQRLPPVVQVFGVSTLPPDFLRLLAALSTHMGVEVLAFNPCAEYWGDIVTPRQHAVLALGAAQSPVDESTYYDVGNPLLAAFGRLSRDFVELLTEWSEASGHVHAPDGLDLFALAPPTLLGRVQNDLLRLVDGSIDELPPEPPIDGDSLAVHLCHSRLREIEVLHDQLLQRFASDPSLKPAELLVMVPDIDAYASVIEAVFGSAPPDRFIPFAISDRGSQTESPLYESLFALLAFEHSRWRASDIMALLETPAIRERFGLPLDSLAQIEHWLSAAGIRWGRDAADWAHVAPIDRPMVDGPADGIVNSWAYGLQRLLLGYAVGDGAAPFAGVAALDGVDGQARDQLNALFALVQRLDGLRNLPRQASAQHWSARLLSLLEDFFALPDDAPESADAMLLTRMRTAAVRLATQSAAAGFDGPLSVAAVRAYLADQIGAGAPSPRFLTGQVSFCTLLPMRTIPFRQVFLVGMNDLDYPRRLPPASFDLLAVAARRGDRSRSAEDRQLFLEALMSARESLYISYVGRSDSDDSVKVPSVLVSDLIDYVALRGVRQHSQVAGTVMPVFADSGEHERWWRDFLIQQHPLQPFSDRYFRVDPMASTGARVDRVFTFDERWTPDAWQAPPLIEAPDEPPLPTTFELAQLFEFMRNPARYLLRDILGVQFAYESRGVLDEEPFALFGLSGWQVKNEAIRVVQRGADLEAWQRRSRLDGLLPHGEYGAQVLTEQHAQLRAFLDDIAELLAARVETLDVDLLLPCGTRLVGALANVGPDGFLAIRPGKLNPRDRVSLLLSHLVLSALDRNPTSRFVDQGHCHLLAPWSVEEASLCLDRLVQLLWFHRHQRPVPLLVETAQEWARTQVALDEKQTQAARKAQRTAVRDAWMRSTAPDQDYQPGEGRDPYVQRLWPGNQPPSGFEPFAEALYVPFFKRLDSKQLR